MVRSIVAVSLGVFTCPGAHVSCECLAAVLHQIDIMKAKKLKPDEFNEAVQKLMRETGLSDAQKDRISHFILRLAFCQRYGFSLCLAYAAPFDHRFLLCHDSEEKRLWFLSQECQLFRYEHACTRSALQLSHCLPLIAACPAGFGLRTKPPTVWSGSSRRLTCGSNR